MCPSQHNSFQCSSQILPTVSKCAPTTISLSLFVQNLTYSVPMCPDYNEFVPVRPVMFAGVYPEYVAPRWYLMCLLTRPKLNKNSQNYVISATIVLFCKYMHVIVHGPCH